MRRPPHPVVLAFALAALAALASAGCRRSNPAGEPAAGPHGDPAAAGVEVPPPQDPAPHPGGGPRGAFPTVPGTFMVRYESAEAIYIDAAVSDGSGSGVAGVVVDLVGPDTVHRDRALTFHTEDSEWDAEWRLVCDFLGDDPPGGLYWLSRVRITANDGSWAEYVADAPFPGPDAGEFATFEVSYRDAAGQGADRQPTGSWVGSVYLTRAPAAGERAVSVHTFLPEGGQAVDAVMRVYTADDTTRWIATSDEPDAYDFYPRVTVPAVPGETYLVQLIGVRPMDHEQDFGHYAIGASLGARPAGAVALAANPDPREPNDDPAHATPLVLGELQSLTLAIADAGTSNEDWFSFVVPAAR